MVECSTTVARFQSPALTTPAAAPNSAHFQTQASIIHLTVPITIDVAPANKHKSKVPTIRYENAQLTSLNIEENFVYAVKMHRHVKTDKGILKSILKVKPEVQCVVRYMHFLPTAIAW